MRAIFCGGREFSDIHPVVWLMTGLNENQLGLVVIEGEAPGLDTLARVVAQKMKIPFVPMPADWKKHGRAAGPIRNGRMLKEGKAQITFAFHDRIEESSGTLDMLRQTVANNLPAYLIAPVDLERIKEIEDWRNFRMTYWWIEGQNKRKSADGKRRWTPLYSVPNEVTGRGLLRLILNDQGDPKEIAMLNREYRDFRLAPPKDEPIRKRARARASGGTVDNSVDNSPRCPSCGRTDLKRVKRDNEKLWKCLGCRKRWPRTSVEASTGPSKARNEGSGSNGTSPRPRRRQKAAQRAS